MPAVGQPIPHESAPGHVTGRAVFIDDIPPARNELYVDVVGSPCAHGRVRRIDLTAARAVPGVVALLTRRDIPGHNDIGPVLKDDHLLVEDVAAFLGDPVVIVAAESREALAAARKLVRIEMDELEPVFSIEDAVAKDSFLGPPRTIARGDVDAALAAAELKLTGELRIGGQDHFYLESQAALALPQENDTLLVHSSTQHPTECQQIIAEVLSLPYNAVTVLCRRMGGGFGGKETQAAQPAAYAALAAHLTKRPARVVFSKDDDMRITGKRHPFLGRYTVGFTRDGRITAYDVRLFSDGGCSADLSFPVMERAMLHADNAYFIPHFRAVGRVCRTNFPSNTAFRGFGGPQGVAHIENVIEQIAAHLALDPLDVRERNLYGAPRHPGPARVRAAAAHNVWPATRNAAFESPNGPLAAPNGPLTTPNEPPVTLNEPLTTPNEPLTTPNEPLTTLNELPVTPNESLATPPKPLTTLNDLPTTPDDLPTTPDDPAASPPPAGGGAGELERRTTPYGQVLQNNVLPALVAQLRRTSDYDARRRAVAAFNAASRTHLKGLSLTPVKFGISFTKQHMNQANALVNVYVDGTVLVTTGATEMGQGVHTRIRQIVADELGVSYDAVRIGTTDTSKNNNTSPSAASATTDLNGAAAANACAALKERIAHFAAHHFFWDPQAGLPPSPLNVVFESGQVYDTRRPDRRLSFAEVVEQAYFHRVNLGERGFYATPGVDYNRETGKGTPFLYYTNGAAVAEVLVDRLTGELATPRVDLLMDAGLPLNPGIDRGQIVGGFVQGMGWVTTEELKYDARGNLLSHSPTTYKIPNVTDTPQTFNVAFFDNPHSTMSLKRSKALGEPPLLLGLSVWAAVKNAIAYANPAGAMHLALPATPEEILRRLTAHPPARAAALAPATA